MNILPGNNICIFIVARTCRRWKVSKGIDVEMVKSEYRMKWMAKNGMILHYLLESKIKINQSYSQFYSLPLRYPKHPNSPMVMTSFQKNWSTKFTNVF